MAWANGFDGLSMSVLLSSRSACNLATICFKYDFLFLMNTFDCCCNCGSLASLFLIREAAD